MAHGDPPATVGALQGRVGMGMGPHSLQHLLTADPGVGHPVGHPVSCLHGILQAKLQGVHAQLLGQLVDHHLHGEGGLGLARRPVRLHLLLVDHHVIPIHQQVVDLVGPQARQGTTAHGRARERSRLIG